MRQGRISCTCASCGDQKVWGQHAVHQGRLLARYGLAGVHKVTFLIIVNHMAVSLCRDPCNQGGAVICMF